MIEGLPSMWETQDSTLSSTHRHTQNNQANKVPTKFFQVLKPKELKENYLKRKRNPLLFSTCLVPGVSMYAPCIQSPPDSPSQLGADRAPMQPTPENSKTPALSEHHLPIFRFQPNKRSLCVCQVAVNRSESISFGLQLKQWH